MNKTIRTMPYSESNIMNSSLSTAKENVVLLYNRGARENQPFSCLWFQGKNAVARITERLFFFKFLIQARKKSLITRQIEGFKITFEDLRL